MGNQVPVKPTDFVQMVWDIDFYNRAKGIMAENFGHRDIHVKRYFLDFIKHLNIGIINRVTARDILSGVGLLQENNVGVSLFDINGYSAANAFVFKHKDSGRVTLYLPRSDFKLMSFRGCFEMQSWVSDACLSNVRRDMIASHFTIADRQDGVFYYGVDAWLDSIGQDIGYYDKIAMNPTEVPSEHFFDSLFDNVKSKEFSDLDSLIKSDAEVRRDTCERLIDASNIIPNPLSPFLSLAMHLEHAIEADTYPEKMQEIQHIKADVANLIAMIALENAMKFPDVEGYDFIKKVKNGLESMETVPSEKFEVVDGDLAAETGKEAAADGTVIGCNRRKRGIASSKHLPCAGVANQDASNS
ncbi:dermonecrotic toxin domain-containing protein [Xanthomonas theicola]|uniref:dermonecrotic toxin domain-containing protein n=1 Tax=Xanthomonas theicola TaxID=56464 RepID=UPI001B8010EF|nr:DUF6543 domain-containing protein [Xanthomonas theicola]